MIVDCSLAMAWCFEDEASKLTDELLAEVVAHGGVVPTLWRIEVANVLAVALRRERISASDARHFMDLLDRLPLEVDHGINMSELVSVASRWNLSTYDANYLILAQRTGRALGTLDERLRTAASSAGVTVLPT